MSLQENLAPELLRVDLQSTVLKIKSLNIGSHDAKTKTSESVSKILGEALRALVILGAVDTKENLTTLGALLSELPVDPWVARLILQGALFSCLDPILTIAACLDLGRNMFAIRPDERTEAREHLFRKFGVES